MFCLVAEVTLAASIQAREDCQAGLLWRALRHPLSWKIGHDANASNDSRYWSACL
jgi:hypothetical protein